MRAPILTQKLAKALRRSLTRPEQQLWQLLRRNTIGFHFRRQHGVGPFILDFYCAAAKLAVEVDGPSHDDTAARDEARTQWLMSQGIRVLRFSVADLEARQQWVLREIAQAADAIRP
jgi:very-short-patch-repair endonuclease